MQGGRKQIPWTIIQLSIGLDWDDQCNCLDFRPMSQISSQCVNCKTCYNERGFLASLLRTIGIVIYNNNSKDFDVLVSAIDDIAGK